MACAWRDQGTIKHNCGHLTLTPMFLDILGMATPPVFVVKILGLQGLLNK